MFRFCTLVSLLFIYSGILAQPVKQNKSKQEYIALRVYHATDQQQLDRIDAYLQEVLVPTMVALQSLTQLELIDEALFSAKASAAVDSGYINARHNQPPYNRFETIVMRAFSGMPQAKASHLKSNKSEQVY